VVGKTSASKNRAKGRVASVAAASFSSAAMISTNVAFRGREM
jgi:hypothetical protein